MEYSKTPEDSVIEGCDPANRASDPCAFITQKKKLNTQYTQQATSSLPLCFHNAATARSENTRKKYLLKNPMFETSETSHEVNV